jgi:endonuclease/exonuclease/phosphatase family metal-dependent hydrolase
MRWWRSGRDGVAIISRFSILAQDVLSLGYDGCVALRANIELPTGHMVDIVSTHLHRPLRQPEVRQEQMMKVVGWLNDRGGAAHQIIAGSMNETPTGMAIIYAKQQYLSAYAAAHGREPMATWPTAMVRSENDWAGCVDYIFVSHTFQVKATRLIGTTHHPENEFLYPSDHIGLLTQLELRPTV